MTLKRVLIADDLETVLEAVVALLQDSFNVVGTASDGRTALAEVLKLEPDMVVLDISMPDMTGIEVARELKCRGNKTRTLTSSRPVCPREHWATCLKRSWIVT
jgi:CheY-like chemotaxis protein